MVTSLPRPAPAGNTPCTRGPGPCGANVATALEPYLKLPPYAFMESVRERRVALIDTWAFSCITHLRIHAYEQLARQLHPERFQQD